VILTAASKIYGAAAAWRRQWYASHPGRRRHLSRPVISVGNLRAGGSGKTPTIVCLARILQSAGERPAVLTRGYRRPVRKPGVTIVSDQFRIIEPFETSGDEPLMLARALPGVPVLVGADRYASGKVAEDRFNATVHLLDDGFQHLALARTIDLLLASEDDLSERLLPAGRLREPLSAAAAADAVLVAAGYESAAARVGRALGAATVFMLSRSIEPPRRIGSNDPVVVPTGEPVFAVAGIARPERFFGDVTSAGWRVAGTMTFPDHHRFSQRDVDEIARRAIAARSTIILTTEKDAVRLAECDLTGLPIATVPLSVTIEPTDDFRSWLFSRLSGTRHPAPCTLHPER
jgi:tetraacyldisaccharide 4'-kinase